MQTRLRARMGRGSYENDGISSDTAVASKTSSKVTDKKTKKNQNLKACKKEKIKEKKRVDQTVVTKIEKSSRRKREEIKVEEQSEREKVTPQKEESVISFLPDIVIDNISEKKPEAKLGDSEVETFKERKERNKRKHQNFSHHESKDRSTLNKDYIPLNVSGPTKFSLVPLDEFSKAPVEHPAANWKKQMIYGSRIERVPYSSIKAYTKRKGAFKKSRFYYM